MNQKEKAIGLLKDQRQAINSVIVGHQSLTIALQIGTLTKGHILALGVPGVGKTLHMRVFAKTLDLQFSRIQFNPDLTPNDILISVNPVTREIDYHGAIHANIVLADEINRTPEKTQSALLEAMQERKYTAYKKITKLPDPFLVLATMNPLDEVGDGGTYPLPKAQKDRFAWEEYVDYPSEEEEHMIVTGADAREKDLDDIRPVIDGHILSQEILPCFQNFKNGAQNEPARRYLERIVRETRPGYGKLAKLDELREFIRFGASPRASLTLDASASARAFIHGDKLVDYDHVKKCAPHILSHRLILTSEAEAEGWTTQKWIEEYLRKVPVD